MKLIVTVFCFILSFSTFYSVDGGKMSKGGGGGGGEGDNWEAYPTGDKCNCNCGGGGGGKTKVIAMEKVIKVPRIRIIDMGKKGDDLQYSKTKSMVGMVMASPDIEMEDDDEPEMMMDPWSS